MGDDQDFSEIRADGINGLDQALAAQSILAAKAFIDNQRLQASASPLDQHLGKGQADGKVDAEGLAAAEQLVITRSGAVADLDVERFLQILAAFIFIGRLGYEAYHHGPFGQAVQDLVRLEFDLRKRLLDQQRRDAILTKGALQLFELRYLDPHMLAFGFHLLAPEPL